jgi:hypothetical protein
MKTLNYGGFGVVEMGLQEFLSRMEDKDILEVVKVEGYVFLHSPKDNQLYAVGEPHSKKTAEDYKDVE